MTAFFKDKVKHVFKRQVLCIAKMSAFLKDKLYALQR
jgi:hypothetical protein